MNTVKVTREAVCAADDQMNPLELILDITASEKFSELVDQVIRSKFLQFSSTYSTLTGFIGEQAIVRVRTDFKNPLKAEYLIEPNALVCESIPSGRLDFKLRASSNQKMKADD